MGKRVKWLLLMLPLGMVVSMTHASEAQLRMFLAEVSNLQADFEQRIVDPSGRTLDFASGIVSLQRPGKFRWDYDAAVDNSVAGTGSRGQQLIADGESIYLFDPDLEQVTKRSMRDAINQVPSLLLVEDSQVLDKFFAISDIGLTDGLSWVAMKPTSADAAYQQLLLAFQGARLAEIHMLDGLGNETRLILRNNQSNIELSPTRFKFNPPDGVDILEE